MPEQLIISISAINVYGNCFATCFFAKPFVKTSLFRQSVFALFYCNHVYAIYLCLRETSFRYTFMTCGNAATLTKIERYITINDLYKDEQ